MSSHLSVEHPYLLGSASTSLFGAITLLFGSFGGWEERRRLGSGAGGFQEIRIGLLDHAVAFVVIGALAVLLLYTAWVALRSLPLGDRPEVQRGLVKGLWTALGAAAGTLACGLVFIVVMAQVDPDAWWLGWGFYGGVTGGGLAALLLRLDMRSGSRARERRR
jgi:hypothetical protein